MELARPRLVSLALGRELFPRGLDCSCVGGEPFALVGRCRLRLSDLERLRLDSVGLGLQGGGSLVELGDALTQALVELAELALFLDSLDRPLLELRVATCEELVGV